MNRLGVILFFGTLLLWFIFLGALIDLTSSDFIERKLGLR